jgi:hypothetical protein
MSLSRKLTTLGTICLVILAASGAGYWLLRSPAVPPVDKSQQERKEREALKLVHLKDNALAALENRDFHEAEPYLLELATLGIGEANCSRNWFIGRIARVSTIDEAKDIKDYAEAVDDCRRALNLEWNMEREGSVRYYLASKVEFLGQNIPKQLEDLHIGAGRSQDNPLMWYELYQTQRDSQDEAMRADGENALKTLFELIPNNLYVLLEWIGVQARLKDATIVETLDRARLRMVPFLSDVPVATPIAPAQAIADASSAAQKGDWSAVARNVTALTALASVQPAVRNDKWRVDHGLHWLIKTDFSDKFYRERPFDRVLPRKSVPVHFLDTALKGPLAELNDVRDARCVDFDADGRLDIAVLRKSSLEVYGWPGKTEEWSKLAAAPLPSDGFTHLRVADLQRNSPAPNADFLVFGPAGVLVVENRLESAAKTRSLHVITSAPLLEATKGVESLVTIDLDHDGALDLVVARKETGAASAQNPAVISVWRNLGGMAFADVTPRSGLSEQMAGKAASAAAGPSGVCSLAAIDLNHDCEMDVLLAGGGPTPSNAKILQGTGEGRFRVQPLAHDSSDFQAATALAVLDADANGSCDVLAAGPTGMFLLLTSSTEPGEVNRVFLSSVSDFPAKELLVLDYDNDGSQDVIAWNGEGLHCLHGTGYGHFEAAADVLPKNVATILSADSGDLDGDGDIDLVVVSPEAGGGRIHLLQNEGGNANNWVDVCLSGGPLPGTSNDRRPTATGIGAVIQLKSGVVSQSRVVSGPVTHFGIGTLESADFLRIVWPNGIPADLPQPAKNRIVRATPPPGGWR